MSSSTSRAWIAAASVGIVEALKDQGFARWNYVLKCASQHAKSNIRSFSQAKVNKKSISSSPSLPSLMSAGRRRGGKENTEESLRTVMYLSCWGPNS